jgi:murein DD-endopeptidase MepM/ murein hydrolase activator NlpD
MPPPFHKVTSGGRRKHDAWGSGAFGASRTGHSHQGLDFVAMAGESVLSPVDGVVTRQLWPYATDTRYTGLEIDGSGEWAGYKIKLFYVTGVKLGKVAAGDVVGTAQDLEKKYKGITNHVHVEVRLNGTLKNPTDLFEP